MSGNWEITWKADPEVSRLADQHYSRQTIGARQFSPPGMTLVLKFNPQPMWIAEAGWVWWHPHENSPIPRKDGFQGWWQCSFFRNASALLSSDLIKEAVEIVNREWGRPPHGYDTYVWPDKILSPNPGYCYQRAGWTKSDHWTQDGKKRRLSLAVDEPTNVR